MNRIHELEADIRGLEDENNNVAEGNQLLTRIRDFTNAIAGKLDIRFAFTPWPLAGSGTRTVSWLPVPYIDTNAAEKLFAHKIFRLLKSQDLLSDERMNLLLSFRNSAFSVDTSPTVWPQDTQGRERLCRYLLRCPVSLSRIHWTPGSKTLFYESKGSHDDLLLSHPKGESLDIFEFIARVLTQIPEPRKHGVHYSGTYASRSRVFRKKRGITLHSLGDKDNSKSKAEPELSPKKRAALRKSWSQLIKRVYQVDPLICDCGATLRVISFITEHKVLRKILDHLDKRNGGSRAPPNH